MHFWSFVFVWFWERGVFLARCFISWVAPDMTTILKARDKRLKEQSEVGKTRLLGLATPSSRAVGLWWRAASGLRPRPRRRRLRSRRPGTRSRRRRPRPPSSRDARWWKRAAARPRRPSLSQPLCTGEGWDRTLEALLVQCRRSAKTSAAS